MNDYKHPITKTMYEKWTNELKPATYEESFSDLLYLVDALMLNVDKLYGRCNCKLEEDE